MGVGTVVTLLFDFGVAFALAFAAFGFGSRLARGLAAALALAFPFGAADLAVWRGPAGSTNAVAPGSSENSQSRI